MSHDDFFAELGIQRDEDAGDAKDKPKSRRQRRMEKVERRQRKRRRHWLTSLVIVITLVAVGVLGYKAIGIMRDASAQATHAEDYKGEGEGEVTVTIPEGASGADIGDILQSKGVVASGKAFTNAAKNNPKGSTIQPGTYKLKKKNGTFQNQYVSTTPLSPGKIHWVRLQYKKLDAPIPFNPDAQP